MKLVPFAVVQYEFAHRYEFPSRCQQIPPGKLVHSRVADSLQPSVAYPRTLPEVGFCFWKVRQISLEALNVQADVLMPWLDLPWGKHRFLSFSDSLNKQRRIFRQSSTPCASRPGSSHYDNSCRRSGGVSLVSAHRLRLSGQELFRSCF